MSPPIQRDWWLAAALTGASLPAAVGQQALPTAAVVTASAPQASATDASTPLYVDNARGQRLVTGPEQSMHVLFSDQSAITLGPGSELTIAEYRFEPTTNEGALVMDLSKGALRVVGGLISKTNETVVRTGTATVGTRGGIALVHQLQDQTNAVFLFGQSMRMTSGDGVTTRDVVRQGFDVTGTQNTVSEPKRMSVAELTHLQNAVTGSNRPPGAAPSLPPQVPSQAPPLASNIAPDRVPTAQMPNAPQDVQSSNTLRNVLGSTPTPNQS